MRRTQNKAAVRHLRPASGEISCSLVDSGVRIPSLAFISRRLFLTTPPSWQQTAMLTTFACPTRHPVGSNPCLACARAAFCYPYRFKASHPPSPRHICIEPGEARKKHNNQEIIQIQTSLTELIKLLLFLLLHSSASALSCNLLLL